MSVTSPALLYIVEKYPLGVKLSGLKSGELSRMPLNMPIKVLTPVTQRNRTRTKAVLKKVRNSRLAYFFFRELAARIRFLVAFTP